MKRAALVVLMIGSLSVAGQASAHGYGGGGGDGGAIVGALIGGAVLGALVGSVASAAPVYAQPVSRTTGLRGARVFTARICATRAAAGVLLR